MKRPTMNRFRAAAHAAALATAFSVIDARAHEFWLDPVDFTPKAGETVPIMHRNGQNFEGDSYPFIRELSRRFTVVDGRGERDVKATEGEDPVAEVRFSQPGLSIVVYHRGPERLVHSTFAKFEETLLEEGLEAVVAEHKASRRPEKGIAETFWRCAKALIQVGGKGGEDRSVGLPIEIVAEKNPYGLAVGDKLPVRVLKDGKPAAGLLLKVFNRDDPERPRRIRTDDAGRASAPLMRKGEFLLSVVAMSPGDKAKDGADWISHWASLTFALK